MKNNHIFTSVPLVAGILLIFSIIVVFLVVASHLIIPLVFAILIWYLINTIEHFIARFKLKNIAIPKWIRYLITILILAAVFNLISVIIATNINKVVEVAPQYQRNLERLVNDLPFGLQPEDVPAVEWLTSELNIGRFIQNIAMELTGFVGNLGIIFIYLIFLFLEQRYFNRKLRMAAVTEKKYEFVKNILSQIDMDIRRYVGIKTLMSLSTAVGSYLVMKWVGLEFASFWALLIFILNFIPNIGSLIATAMPFTLALLQFETIGPALSILAGVGGLQLLIGNFIDPALMGKSLNVSPLVIILSLVFWGVIWNIPGMFLSVPITVIMMIILNSFDKTKWIARLLSRDGNLKNLHTS